MEGLVALERRHGTLRPRLVLRRAGARARRGTHSRRTTARRHRLLAAAAAAPAAWRRRDVRTARVGGRRQRRRRAAAAAADAAARTARRLPQPDDEGAEGAAAHVVEEIAVRRGHVLLEGLEHRAERLGRHRDAEETVAEREDGRHGAYMEVSRKCLGSV